MSVTAYDGEPGEKELIEKSIHDEHLTYPCFLDQGSTWQHAVGTNGTVPFFLIIDKRGHVIFRYHQKLTEGSVDYERLAAVIESALGAS